MRVCVSKNIYTYLQFMYRKKYQNINAKIFIHLSILFIIIYLKYSIKKI